MILMDGGHFLTPLTAPTRGTGRPKNVYWVMYGRQGRYRRSHIKILVLQNGGIAEDYIMRLSAEDYIMCLSICMTSNQILKVEN